MADAATLTGWVPDPDSETPHWINPAWPCWHAWAGVAGWFYARRPRTSPPKVVRAETLDGLGVQIELAEGRQW
jgi:hypothetical protein